VMGGQGRGEGVGKVEERGDRSVSEVDNQTAYGRNGLERRAQGGPGLTVIRGGVTHLPASPD
jgi:hypothetical protein